MSYIPISSPLVAVFNNASQTTASREYDLRFNQSLYSSAFLPTATEIKTVLDCALIGDVRWDISTASLGTNRFVSNGIKDGAQRGYNQSGTSGGGGGISTDLAVARFTRMKDISLVAYASLPYGYAFTATAYYTRALGVLT